MNPGPSHSAPAQSAFGAWRTGFWRRVIATSDAKAKRRYMAATFLMVVVIGVADYLSGFELSLLVFYLLPVCTAVAAVGWRFGVVTAVLSVATWLTGDYLAGARFTTALVPGWNALIALGTYLVVIWLLASVIALQREMENRVRQRTAALTEEIAERVRLEKAILGISERERAAIGHDLHDGLSQHLTGTALVAQALETKLAPRQPQEAAEVQKVVALIEQAIEQTRRLAKGLLLAEVESSGLVNALSELAAASRAQFRIDCAFECGAPSAPAESGVATHLFRIAEEAVRNAVRHGRARRVEIRLTRAPDALVLEIRDDGSGMPEPARRGRGLGLSIMAHRAAIIGASFAIERTAPGGTSVVCRLPQPATQP